mgnify:CR=1 FL=1
MKSSLISQLSGIPASLPSYAWTINASHSPAPTTPFIVGQRVITSPVRDALFSIFDFLKASGITATRVELERATGDLRVTSDAGLIVFFNLRNNIRAFLPSLDPVRSSGVDFTKLQYIDLRVPTKVYYR